MTERATGRTGEGTTGSGRIHYAWVVLAMATLVVFGALMIVYLIQAVSFSLFALGFITLFFGIGQAVAPGIAGAMADATGSFSSAFLLAAGVACVGLAGSWLLRPSVPGAENPGS